MTNKSHKEEIIFNEILLSGIIRISSYHTNLLYRLTFKIIKDHLFKNNISKIIYISSKTVPIGLLNAVISETLLNRLLIKQIHSLDELIFILKLYFFKIKKKTISLSGVFIDSLDHLLLERQFSFAEMQSLQKLLNKVRFLAIKNSLTIYLINKEKIEADISLESILYFREMDYFINDKILIQRESTGVYFMRSLKKMEEKFLIKNPEAVNSELYF